MDDRKHTKSQRARGRRGDAGVAPPADPASTNSSVVFFSSAEEVSEGFATALRAMGFDEVLLSELIPQSGTTSNPEER